MYDLAFTEFLPKFKQFPDPVRAIVHVLKDFHCAYEATSWPKPTISLSCPFFLVGVSGHLGKEI
jgi:hypothetical protein